MASNSSVLASTYSGGLQTLFTALLQGYNVILLFYHLWVLMFFAYVYRVHACAYVSCMYIYVFNYMCVVVQVCGRLRCHHLSLSTSLHLNYGGRVSHLKLQLISRTSQFWKLALGCMSLPSSAEMAGCCHACFFMGSGDLNSGPHGFMAGALPIEPSLQPFIFHAEFPVYTELILLCMLKYGLKCISP